MPTGVSYGCGGDVKARDVEAFRLQFLCIQPGAAAEIEDPMAVSVGRLANALSLAEGLGYPLALFVYFGWFSARRVCFVVEVGMENMT